MKRILIIFLALTLMLSGCKKEEEKAPSYPVEAFGETFAERPSAVLSLNPAGEEIMKVLGYGHSLLDASEAFKDRENPEADEVLKLNPDFVILSPETRKSVVDALTEKGVKTVTLDRFPHDFELLSFLEEMSLIFEGLNDIELKNQQLEYYFDATREALLTEGQKLLEENGLEAPAFLFVTGENFALTSDTMEAAFLEEMGMVNLAGDRENYFVPFNELPRKPDILIYPSHLPKIAEALGGNLEASYDYERILHQSPSVFNMREELLEDIFGEEIEITNNFMPLPEPPSEEEAEN